MGLDVSKAALVNVNDAVAADVDAAVAAAAVSVLYGFTLRESAGAAAVATGKIINGATVAAGTVIAPFELAANESKTVWFGPPGINANNGLSIDHIAGTFDCELYYQL